jgi:hypothetical protein
MSKGIKISGDLLDDMFVSEYNYEAIGSFVDPDGKYTGWHIEADKDGGEYDGEKGSMYNFEVHLYRPYTEADKDDYCEDESVYVGTAIGGYYNGQVGYCFSNDLTFYPPAKRTKTDDLNDFLTEVAESDESYKKKINKIKKHIQTL